VVALAVSAVGETVRNMRGSRHRGEQTQRAAVLAGRESSGVGNNQGCRGEDQDRGVFGVFLVQSAYLHATPYISSRNRL
jgi:hypothetical protein